VKKLQIFKIISLFYIALFFFYCSTEDPEPPTPPTPTQCETRGTWLWASSIDSSDKRDFVLDKILEANLNTVFVSIPSINGNYGHGNTNSFLDFITKAKAAGLSLHAWMANGRRKGRDIEIDFRDLNEQEAQIQWVMSIMSNYGQYLDGVHLDYIRYSNSEAVNNNFKMDAVTEMISRIHNFLSSNYPGKYLTATSFVLGSVDSKNGSPPQWFINWKTNNPNNIYSNNKVPYFMQVQQDPIKWLNNQIIDGVMPMQYTIDDGMWNQEIDVFKSFNSYNDNDQTKILMGLGWMEKTSPTSTRGYDPAGIVRKIKYGRLQGMKGFVIFILFNHGYDDSPLIEALTIDSAENNNDAPFKKAAPSCFK